MSRAARPPRVLRVNSARIFILELQDAADRQQRLVKTGGRLIRYPASSVVVAGGELSEATALQHAAKNRLNHQAVDERAAGQDF
jgi:hypothetical protein